MTFEMGLKEYVINADIYVQAVEDSEDNTDWPEAVRVRLIDVVGNAGYDAHFGELEEI